MKTYRVYATISGFTDLEAESWDEARDKARTLEAKDFEISHVEYTEVDPE
jgi:hypothetical protein